MTTKKMNCKLKTNKNMKKVFLFLLPVFIISCVDDGIITLSDKSVTIQYDESKQLSVNYSSDALKTKTYNYTTSDSTIVSVSSTGLVSGVSIGTAVIKISSKDGKYKDECNFTVTPKSNLYVEPITDFGLTISQVKSKETRTLSQEGVNYLVYTDSNPNVRMILYVFNGVDMTLNGSVVMLTEASDIAAEASLFLIERYRQYDFTDTYKIYKNRKDTLKEAVLSYDKDYGLSVQYWRRTPVL